MKTKTLAARLLAITALWGTSAADVVSVDTERVVLDHPTVVIVTHASQYFDPLKITQQAVNRVLTSMKQVGVPIVCFHDQNNPENPADKYLYDTWDGLTVVNSGVGRYDFNMSAVRHVIVMGGYFSCCEKHSVMDTVSHWRRDAPEHDLRITQVVDGIFDMADGVPESSAERVRNFQREFVWTRHPKAAITVEQTLVLIADHREGVEFLKSQLPEFPDDVDVTLDYFGELIPVVRGTDAHQESHDADARRSRPELILAFRSSRDIDPDFPKAIPQRPSRKSLSLLLELDSTNRLDVNRPAHSD